MKLLTEEIKKSLPKLGETDELPDSKKVVQAKFFTPWTNWTWYVVEGEEQPDGNWLFFGLVEGLAIEWGCFDLWELEALDGPFGLKIERDIYFGNPTIEEVKRRLV